VLAINKGSTDLFAIQTLLFKYTNGYFE
jgi:hypothetical protein